MVIAFGIRYEPANLDELEAKIFDLGDYTEQRGLIGQRAGQEAVVALLLHRRLRERSKRGWAKMAPDANRVA